MIVMFEKFDDHTDLMEQAIKQCNRSVVTASGNRSNAKEATLLKTVHVGCDKTYQQKSKGEVISRPTTTMPSVTVGQAQQPSVRNRLIFTSYRNRTLSQLDIHSNVLSRLSVPDVGEICSLCYVETTHQLLIGLYEPQTIMSTTLDGATVTTLREPVWTKSMAVDEVRGLIFMTTETPGFTVSKMSLTGGNYAVVRDMSDFWGLYGIAVDSQEEGIYVCTNYRLIRVSYSGDIVETLVTGDYIYDVSFDSLENVLYYNKDKTLMKMSVADRVGTRVITLDVKPWTFSFYNNTLYYDGKRYVGAVQIGENVVNTKLQTIDNSRYVSELIICLLP